MNGGREPPDRQVAREESPTERGDEDTLINTTQYEYNQNYYDFLGISLKNGVC